MADSSDDAQRTPTLTPTPHDHPTTTTSSDRPIPKVTFPAHWTQHSSRKLPLFAQPTRIHFHARGDGEYRWDSRAHRKGRSPVEVGKEREEEGWGRRLRKIRWWGWDFGDISWWVAQLFLLGSVFWCANGILAFCFSTLSTPPILNAESATAFIGGTLFIVGAYLSYVESLNPAADAGEAREKRGALGRRRRHFGRHVRAAVDRHVPGMRRGVGEDVGDGDGDSRRRLDDDDARVEDGEQLKKNNGDAPKWKWFGADWSSFGFVANAIQLFGATIFWISVLCGLPGVLPNLGSESSSGLPAKNLGLWEGLYWVPQIIGSWGFIISGYMFSLEVQSKWYKPNITSLGWHVGFWNLIGGFGFLFCGIFGLFREVREDWAQLWGTAFSTFWGSWSFLLASYLQLLETLNKQ